MAGGKARSITVALATLLLIAAGAPQAHAGGQKDKSQIFAITETGPQPVSGAWSMLERDGDAVHVKVRTRLAPGHVDTLWAVIFNNPSGCSGPGGPDDIVLDPADHSAGFNVAGIQAAQITATWAGGAIANAAGRWKLDATIVEGVLPTGPRQQLLGAAESAIFSLSSVDGLVNAAGAEIQFILQDHGPAHTDPELLAQQLSMFRSMQPRTSRPLDGQPGELHGGAVLGPRVIQTLKETDDDPEGQHRCPNRRSGRAMPTPRGDAGPRATPRSRGYLHSDPGGGRRLAAGPAARSRRVRRHMGARDPGPRGRSPGGRSRPPRPRRDGGPGRPTGCRARPRVAR